MKSTLLLFLLVAFCGTAHAQVNDSLIVLFLSDPGVRVGDVLDGILDHSSPKRFDATGDGQANLIMRRENNQGGLQDVRVLGFEEGSPTEICTVEDVPTTLGITSNMDMWGFADVNGDGFREAIFYNDSETVGRSLCDNENIEAWRIEQVGKFRMVGAADLTGDGHEEIILFLEDTQQLQIWQSSGSIGMH